MLECLSAIDVRPESQFLFGEVLFLLLGLKPMILCENIPQSCTLAFHSICEAFTAECAKVHSGTGDAMGEPVCGFVSLTTTHFSCSGCLVLTNARSPRFANVVECMGITPSPQTSGKPTAVSEAELADALDYPVSLDEFANSADDGDGKELIEVGYILHNWIEKPLLHATNQGLCRDDAPRLSTCYGVTHEYQQQVDDHFTKYRTACAGVAVLELELRQCPKQASTN